MSHDTDLIIQNDEKIKQDKRKKRKRKNKKKDSQGQPDVPPDTCESPEGKRTHLENMELEAEVDLQDQAMPKCEPEHQKTVSDEPEDSAHGVEPTKTASKNGTDESQPEASSVASETTKEKKVEGGTHRAGFDAFMTGYIFAFAKNLTAKTEESTSAALLSGCLNKLFLSGKSVPLHVAKSTFSKSSKAHVHKMEFIWGKSTEQSA